MAISKEIVRKHHDKYSTQDLHDYIADIEKIGEKTDGAVYYENLISTDSKSVAKEIESTIALNARCKNPLKHIVLSFGSENLSNEEVHKAAKNFEAPWF